MIRLVKMNRSHLSWVMQQRNRPELIKYFRQTNPIQFSQQVDWWDRLNHKNVNLYLVHNNQSEYVGYVALNPIDPRHKHAEFGVFIVPEHQNKGYAQEAMLEILSIGFNGLGLNKIYSDVLDYPGEGRFEFYKKLGFREEGRLKQHYLKDGKWIDAIQFAMLADEYKKNQSRLEPRNKESANTKVEVLG